MGFLDSFIRILFLVLTLCSSAMRSTSDSASSTSFISHSYPINKTTVVVTHSSTSLKSRPSTSETISKEATLSELISKMAKTTITTASIFTETTSTIKQSQTTIIPGSTAHTSTTMTSTTSHRAEPSTSTTQDPITQKSTTTINNISTLPDYTTQTFKTMTSSTQPGATTAIDDKEQTTTMPTATNNRKNSTTITTNDHSKQTLTTNATSSTTQAATTIISSNTAETSSAMTNTTNITTQPPTAIPTHTTETLFASTATKNNTQQVITTNTSGHITQTSTPTITRNTTLINISTQTKEIFTPTTTQFNISTQPSTTALFNISQTSATKKTTNKPITTKIPDQTTHISTLTTATFNVTILSISLLPTTLGQASTEQKLTSEHESKQTTKEYHNKTIVTSAVQSPSDEPTMDILESTTSIGNNTSGSSSMQTKTTRSSSSTSSSVKPLTTNSNSRTTTLSTSIPKTTLHPEKTTFTIPNTTLVPTEILLLGFNNTLSLQFTMLITIDRNELDSTFNKTIFTDMLKQYVLTGYESSFTIFVSDPPRYKIKYRRKKKTNAWPVSRQVRDLNSMANKSQFNITIDVGIPVIKLREHSKTIAEYASDISKNIRQNISNITSPNWYAENISDEIEKQLQSQIKDMTECDAPGKLCPLGYECKTNKGQYTGECVHRCDLETIDCKNDGHCIFDSVRNKAVCSCGSTWSSLYYGAGCEDQTGKLEVVIGFTLGSAVLLIVLVFIALLCCKRSHGSIKEFRRPEDKATLESDFLSETGGVQVMDLNYRQSTKFNPNSLDVEPVGKVMDTDQAGGNVSETLETSGCSTISSENSDNFSQEHKHRESGDSKARQPGEEDSVFSTFVPSTSLPAVTLEISRTSTETDPENRINHGRKSFLFGP